MVLLSVYGSPKMSESAEIKNYYNILESRKSRVVVWASLRTKFSRILDFIFEVNKLKCDFLSSFPHVYIPQNLRDNWHFQIICYPVLSLLILSIMELFSYHISDHSALDPISLFLLKSISCVMHKHE